MEALAEQRRRLMAWPHLRSSVAVVGLLVWMLLLSSVLTVAIVLPIVNPPSIPHYDSVPPQWADDPTVLHQLAPSETTYEHWDVVLRKGKIVAVAPLEEKGEDRIFRAQLVVGEEEKQDGGSGGETYEVVVRMSMHEDEASAEEKRDTRDLTTLKTSKRDGMRAQPAIRGWSGTYATAADGPYGTTIATPSYLLRLLLLLLLLQLFILTSTTLHYHHSTLLQADVVAYHSDCVLGLGRALPAVGRRLSNRQLYASATSAAADEIRNRDVFAVPVALVPWVEKVNCILSSFFGSGPVLFSPLLSFPSLLHPVLFSRLPYSTLPYSHTNTHRRGPL